MDTTTNEAKPIAQEGFALVLLGSMNPALHHPSWYEAVGAITEAEEQEALAREFIFVPQVAQFSTSSIEIFCDPLRWQVGSTNMATIERLVAIASVIFDERLVETPLSAVGLNLHMHRKTAVADVSKPMSEMIARLPLGFHPQPGTSGKVTFIEPVNAGRVRWEVEPSTRGKDMLYVATNLHIDLGVAPKPTKFNLRSVLDSRIGDYQKQTTQRVAAMIKAINEFGAG